MGTGAMLETLLVSVVRDSSVGLVALRRASVRGAPASRVLSVGDAQQSAP
jgi:hypothetical protein